MEDEPFHMGEAMKAIRCIGTMSLGALLVAGFVVQNSWAEEDKEEKITVRHLKFAPKDLTVSFMIGGQSKMTTLTDAAAVEKLVGKDAAKELIDIVDFGKEAIVLVSWTTAGPPDGMLQHELMEKGKDRRLTFFVQGPPGAKERGARARIGADFFAVPKNLAVSFDSKERN
jgi:hypothetical protein